MTHLDKRIKRLESVTPGMGLQPVTMIKVMFYDPPPADPEGCCEMAIIPGVKNAPAERLEKQDDETEAAFIARAEARHRELHGTS